MKHTQTATSEFETFGFHTSLLRDIDRIGWTSPTPIQAEAIPPSMLGHDLIASAQTGTGKTGAFVLPIVHKLQGGKGMRALVLAPTRELASQIQETFEELGKGSGIVSVPVYGGVGIEPQVEAVRKGPDVLVATPGRLIDLLMRRVVKLTNLKVLVLDEADRMLDMGFMPQIRRILQACPKDRQTLLFSATIPTGLERLIYGELKNPVHVNIGLRTNPAERADQRVMVCDNFEKQPVLMRLLEEEQGTVLVFTRTRIRAERLGRTLKAMNYKVARLHSMRTQAQREQALEGFKSGKYRILVATDIAARGIDVANIAHVINYDIPQTPDDYVHRVGRTARAEASGRATTIVTLLETGEMKSIEKAIGKAIPRFTGEGVPIVELPPPPPRPFGRRKTLVAPSTKSRRR